MNALLEQPSHATQENSQMPIKRKGNLGSIELPASCRLTIARARFKSRRFSLPGESSCSTCLIPTSPRQRLKCSPARFKSLRGTLVAEPGFQQLHQRLGCRKRNNRGFRKPTRPAQEARKVLINPPWGSDRTLPCRGS